MKTKEFNNLTESQKLHWIKTYFQAIYMIAGNLPDKELESATGANDARYRGGMVVSARELAKEALKIMGE